MVILTGIYTIMGGLRAGEVLQAFVLIIGSFFITFIGLDLVGRLV